VGRVGGCLAFVRWGRRLFFKRKCPWSGCVFVLCSRVGDLLGLKIRCIAYRYRSFYASIECKLKRALTLSKFRIFRWFDLKSPIV
jgi:hypothetical protein